VYRVKSDISVVDTRKIKQLVISAAAAASTVTIDEYPVSY